MGIEMTRNQRGFLQFDDEVATDYGHRVRIFESSAAFKGPVCWMSVKKDDEGYDGQVPPCSVGVHLTLAQAVAIRDRFTAFIDAAMAGQTCEETQ
jgi:hypothetical protein